MGAENSQGVWDSSFFFRSPHFVFKKGDGNAILIILILKLNPLSRPPTALLMWRSRLWLLAGRRPFNVANVFSVFRALLHTFRCGICRKSFLGTRGVTKNGVPLRKKKKRKTLRILCANVSFSLRFLSFLPFFFLRGGSNLKTSEHSWDTDASKCRGPFV